MEEISETKLNNILDRLARAGGLFKHLPYSNLRRFQHHKVGTLALWPKYKTLGSKTWDGAKWRPLASYAGHRFKRLFNLASRWTAFVLDDVEPGFHIASPARVLTKIHDFNFQLEALPSRGIDIPSLVTHTADIPDFFTFV